MGRLLRPHPIIAIALCIWIVFRMAVEAQLSPPKPGNTDTAQAEFFEAKVRPILVGRCVQCHNASNRSGGLRLDTRDGLLQGGGHGPVVAPGKPAESRLLKAVSYTD